MQDCKKEFEDWYGENSTAFEKLDGKYIFMSTSQAYEHFSAGFNYKLNKGVEDHILGTQAEEIKNEN